MENQKNYTATGLGHFNQITRVTLKDTLSLTGAEVSANRIPAGGEIPFTEANMVSWLSGNPVRNEKTDHMK